MRNVKSIVLGCAGILFLGCSLEANAQRQQVTEFYRPPLEIPMDGKITYSFRVNEDGEKVKDGPLSVKASLNNFEAYVNFRKLKVNGSYTLNANNSNDFLDGKMNLNSRLSFTYDGKTELHTFTFSGNFKKGVPNGNFVANYKSSIDEKMNVTYANGKLVGPFMVDYASGVVDRETVKGTLSAKGVPVGRWELSYVDNKSVWTFLNGVLVSRSGKEWSTAPSLVEKGKQYANGNVTEAELLDQGIMVFEDSLNLGKYVTDIILRGDVVNLRSLGLYDFSYRNWIKYKYLEKMVFLTDQGFDSLIAAIRSAIVSRNLYSEVFYKLTTSDDPCWNMVASDSHGLYVKVPPHYYSLTTAKTYKNKVYDKIYLTKAQSALLEERVEQARREYAVGLADYLRIVEESNYRTKFKKLENPEFENLPMQDVKDLYVSLKGISLDSLQTTPDNQFYLLDFKGVFYIKKTVVDEYNDALSKLAGIMKAYCEQTYGQKVEVVYSDGVLENIHELDDVLKCLDFLKNKSSLSVAYDDKVWMYFCGTGEYWRSDLKKKIGKFTKITHIKLTDYRNGVAQCELTRKNKEVYQMSIPFKDGKISVDLLKPEDAKLIREY